MEKTLPVLGCCGILCGLCPRFYTKGPSRCPGCGGEGFSDKHPPCSFKSCCADQNGLPVCALCERYPCAKFADRQKITRDSFVSHRRIFENHEEMKMHGLPAFSEHLNARMALLQQMLAQFDDGRSKSFYCLAAALLPQDALRASLREAGEGHGDKKTAAKALRKALTAAADREHIDLKLR